MKKLFLFSSTLLLSVGSFTFADIPVEERKKMELERLERQKSRLNVELEKAVASKNVDWLQKNQELLISCGLISQKQYQQTINDLTIKQEPPSQQVPQAAAETEMKALGQKRYKAHLQKEYEEACEKGDITWLNDNKDILITQHIISRREFAETISVLNLPRKEQDQKDQKKRDQEKLFRSLCMDKIKNVTAYHEQTTYAQALAGLYEAIVGRDENTLKTIIALAKITDLGKFYVDLNKLMENPKIATTIGNEIQHIRGNMLYRICEDPQVIATTPGMALKIFKNASVAKDINAMINIYRDFLSSSPSNNDAMSIIYDAFMRALKEQDMSTIIDLYLHFFKKSEKENGTALFLLNDYAEQLIAKRDIENLKKLLICLEKTDYEQTIVDAIKTLETNMDIADPQTPNSSESTSPRHIVYEEWQAATINQDLERLLELRKDVIRLGICEADIADGIIQSLIQ